jgi:hypothetical protein
MRHAWTGRCHRRHCTRIPEWTATHLDHTSERLCAEHAAETVFYGHGVVCPIEAADRRWEAHSQEAA